MKRTCRLYYLVGIMLSAIGTVASAQTPPPPAVIGIAAQQISFADRIEAFGTLKANESITVTATVTDTLAAVHFDDGARVRQGQVLVELTNTEERALLEEARATVAEARQQHERVRALATQGSTAATLVDQRRREWETAQARLSAIESRLADRLIRAPFSGIVGLRELSVGALVEPGDVITTLDDDRTMKLDFTIAETFLANLQAGLDITATTRAYPGQRFPGKVISISPRVDPISRSIQVRAHLPNPDGLLKPGMLMRVELSHNPRQAIVIPEEALVPKGDQQFVYSVDQAQGNSVHKRQVRIGTRRPGQVEIVAGLEAGVLVITHGTQKVKEGQAVSIQLDDQSKPLAEMLQTGRTP